MTAVFESTPVCNFCYLCFHIAISAAWLIIQLLYMCNNLRYSTIKSPQFDFPWKRSSNILKYDQIREQMKDFFRLG